MRLHVEDIGTGPVIVLIHGFPLDHTMWAEQLNAWPGYRVIAPDLRGYGRSHLPEDTLYTIDQIADDVIDTLDAIGVNKPFVLGGLSMGGYVAMSIAERRPERLRGLMLLDTRAVGDTAKGEADRIRTVEQIESSGGDTRPFVADMLPKLLAPDARTRTPMVAEQVATIMNRAPAQAVTATLLGLAARPDRSAILPRISVPTLVLVGEHDAITPPDGAREMAQAIPGSTFVTIPGAGHLTPLENPQATNAAIDAFLKSLLTL